MHLWHAVSANSYGDCLITLSTSKELTEEMAAEVGLFTDHAYAVLNVIQTCNGTRLLQLKNPWAADVSTLYNICVYYRVLMRSLDIFIRDGKANSPQMTKRVGVIPTFVLKLAIMQVFRWTIKMMVYFTFHGVM